MGNLTIKNKVLRCEKCFMLKKFNIEPNYPQTTISFECICGFNRQSLLLFTKELQKEELFKVKCSFCGREPKHPSYCTGCRKTYCTACKKSHNNQIQTKTPHKLIDSYKFDFYCSTHQDQLVSGYCISCSLNICQNCINEKLHKDHRFVKYTKILLNQKEEENLKNNLRINENKIQENINQCNSLLAQQNNEAIKKELRDVCNTTCRDNKSILALIKYFYKMYTDSKHKNYTLILNVKENIKFNPNRLITNKITSIEQKTLDYLEFLKREFILFKRFNSDKVRSYTTIGNTQMMNKRINKVEKKSEDNAKAKMNINQENNTENKISEKNNNTNNKDQNIFKETEKEKQKESNNINNDNQIIINNNNDNNVNITDKIENNKNINDNENNNNDNLNLNNIKINHSNTNNNENIVNIKEILNEKYDQNDFNYNSDEEININFGTVPATIKDNDIKKEEKINIYKKDNDEPSNKENINLESQNNDENKKEENVNNTDIDKGFILSYNVENTENNIDKGSIQKKENNQTNSGNMIFTEDLKKEIDNEKILSYVDDENYNINEEQNKEKIEIGIKERKKEE